MPVRDKEYGTTVTKNSCKKRLRNKWKILKKQRINVNYYYYY